MALGSPSGLKFSSDACLEINSRASNVVSRVQSSIVTAVVYAGNQAAPLALWKATVNPGTNAMLNQQRIKQHCFAMKSTARIYSYAVVVFLSPCICATILPKLIT